MPTIYDSYPPDKKDLAEKKEDLRFQSSPVKKEEDEISYSKYMISHPLKNRPFEKLLKNWR
jgi:hypothetical protein